MVSDFLINSECSCCNLSDENINTNLRIYVSNDYKIVRQKLDPLNIKLIINFEVPINVKRFLQNSGCTGHFGILGTSVTMCTKKELEFIREISENISVSLSPIPKDLTPEYFYYIENPNIVDSTKLNDFIQDHVISNTESKFLTPVFKTPVLPDINYLITTEKSNIDLSGNAIQELLYDQTNDEADWFEKEQFFNIKDKPKTLTTDQIIDLKQQYKEKLDLPYPVQPLSRMMETESWSHPSNNNVTYRLKLWRRSVYMSKSKSNKKKTKSLHDSESSNIKEKEENKNGETKNEETTNKILINSKQTNNIIQDIKIIPKKPDVKDHMDVYDPHIDRYRNYETEAPPQKLNKTL